MPSATSRRRLLDAAVRIVSEESLSDLSIDRVTDRAGLARRTFFLHFRSKDELLAEMLDHLRPAYATQFAKWAEDIDPDLPAEQRVIAMLRKFVEATNDPAWRGCCFVRMSAEFGERVGHPVHAAVAGAHNDFETWLGAELGKGNCAAPGLVARQLIIALNGLVIMQLVHREPSFGEALMQMATTLLSAG